MTTMTTMFEFNNKLSIYIPRVSAECAYEAIIQETFKNNLIGLVSRVDFVKKDNNEYQAFVHFEYWNDTQSTRNLQSRIMDPHREARLVYDDPCYWLLLKNKNLMSEIEVRLEKRIMDLEEKNKIHLQIEIMHLNRIMEMETKIAQMETEMHYWNDPAVSMWRQQHEENQLTPLWCHRNCDINEQQHPEWYDAPLNYNCTMCQYADQTKESDELSVIENGDNVCDYYDYCPYDMEIIE